MSLLGLCARLEGLEQAGTAGQWTQSFLNSRCGINAPAAKGDKYFNIGRMAHEDNAALVVNVRNALPAVLPVLRAAAEWERAGRNRDGTERVEIEWVNAIATLRAAVREADATKGGQR